MLHAADGRNRKTKIVFRREEEEKRKRNFPSISQFYLLPSKENVFVMKGRRCSCCESQSTATILAQSYKANGNVKTYFDAVKIRLSTHVMSLIDASVFISAKASNVFTFHNLISPPRQTDSRISE